MAVEVEVGSALHRLQEASITQARKTEVYAGDVLDAVGQADVSATTFKGIVDKAMEADRPGVVLSCSTTDVMALVQFAINPPKAPEVTEEVVTDDGKKSKK